MERNCVHYYFSRGTYAHGFHKVSVCCLMFLLINASFPVYKQVGHFPCYELLAASRVCSACPQINGQRTHRSTKERDADRAPLSAHCVTASGSSSFFPTQLFAGAVPTRASGWQQSVGVGFDVEPRGESWEKMESNSSLRRYDAQPVINSLRIKRVGTKPSFQSKVELATPKSSNASQFVGSRRTTFRVENTEYAGSNSFSAGSGDNPNSRFSQQAYSAVADESPLPQQTRTTWHNTSSQEKATGRQVKQIGHRKRMMSGERKKEAQHEFRPFESAQSTLQLLLPTVALILKAYLVINRVYYVDVVKRMHGPDGLLTTLRVLHFKYSHHPAALASSLIQYIVLLVVLQWKAAKHSPYTK